LPTVLTIAGGSPFFKIERFCSLYSIRALSLEDISEQMFGTDDPETMAHAVVAGIHANPHATAGEMVVLPSYMNPTATAAAAAAAASADPVKFSKKQTAVIHKASQAVAHAEHALVHERKLNFRREQRRISLQRKESKHREKEESAARKAAERAQREAEREERRRRKLELREERERFAQEQKEAALKRAAELVSSNRVPIEITRGVAAAKAAQLAIQAGSLGHSPIILPPPPTTKKRSAVIVSTARDLNQIVIHSKNLWAKYNAIAKEHNQKVNWITVARELGINVKVREKYARMHARAEQRGFDWYNNGHWKIKDHPEVRIPWASIDA
jgi:flagellar biosynthesis GTPase FlhF